MMEFELIKFAPRLMCLFCTIYLIYLSFIGGYTRRLRVLVLFQAAMCGIYLIGMHFKGYGNNAYLITCEIIYFSILVIINSEFCRNNFNDLKHKAREFVAFIKVMHPLPEDDKNRVSKAYFDKFPKLELLQTTTKIITYTAEIISFAVMLSAIILFITS